MEAEIVGVEGWQDGGTATATLPESDARSRIMEALRVIDGDVPAVGEETLSRYYEYLSANLSMPFVAYYREPTNSGEETEYRCTVLELLDPATYPRDKCDGIYCRILTDRDEVNLPLDELLVPQESPQWQMLEDYWYWFWNFRRSWLAPIRRCMQHS